MLIFFVICALLIIVALIIILPSLLANKLQVDVDRKKINYAVYEKKLKELEYDRERDLIDTEQFKIARSDLQRSLINDLAGQKELVLKKSNKLLPIIIIIFIPVIAVSIYLKINNGLISLSPDFETQLQSQIPSIEQAIASLEKKLKQDPSNIDGWMMLGRSYLISEKFDAAVMVYSKANEITNGANPDILVAYGEAKGFSAGQKFNEAMLALFTRALQIDPTHKRGLWYAGLAAYQLEDFRSSVEFWEKLLQQVPNDQSEAKSALQVYLNSARQKGGIRIADNSQIAGQEALNNIGIGKARITVHVSLSKKLEEKVTKSDPLFIYARAQNGPKMPLALVKMTAGDLPATVILDDSISMIPSMTLSNAEQVEIIARISKSGQAIMQSGDMYGSVQSITTKKFETVDVIISDLVP